MLLDEQHKRLGRPLRVLEVGIGQGKMLAFMGGPRLSAERFALPDWIERWDGIDVQVMPETLKRYSYSDYIEADIERPIDLRGRRYDAVILLHVLEHLYQPELAVRHLAAGLEAGGIVIGGSPTMPDALAAVHRYWLHRKFSSVLDDVHAHRHLSVITPGLVRKDRAAGKLDRRFPRRHVLHALVGTVPRKLRRLGAGEPGLGRGLPGARRRNLLLAAQARLI